MFAAREWRQLSQSIQFRVNAPQTFFRYQDAHVFRESAMTMLKER
jgi:hypothetical protein